MATEYSKIVSDYLENLFKFGSEFSKHELVGLVRLLIEKRNYGNFVFMAGNGGSASTASHFATDIGIGGLNRTRPVRALSLCDNSAVVTASANDNGYDSIFKNQLVTLAQKGDLLIVISASGNSANLINAIEFCDSSGIEVFSLTGFDGGKVREMTVGRNIHIETPLGSYGIVEDLHLSICHMVTECLRAG